MFQARVYKIMIGAPSDIKEEIGIVEEVLYKWNKMHSKKQDIVLLPSHWSTDAYPLSGLHPQKIINEQVVEKSDLLICIFGARIGTQTDSSESGTVEEINEHLKARKQVMIFFKKSCSDVDDIDEVQITKLKKFKQSMRNKALLWEFKDATDFKEIFSEKLQLFINDYFLKDERKSQQMESLKPSLAESQLSEFDIERLKAWTRAKHPQFIQQRFLDGSRRYVLGFGNQYTVVGGKEEAEWDDFFNKLLALEFIYIEIHDKQGLPIYKLTKKAYDFIEKLNTEMM